MDELQGRIAHVALRSLAKYGFVLAGGQSLQVHGLVDRPSADLDLFTDQVNPAEFSAAVGEVAEGLTRAGFSVTVDRNDGMFARLEVVEAESGQQGVVDMAVDPRGYPPALLEVGPVLDVRDAVGNKVVTVFGRGYARDYIDLTAILRSGRYRRVELLGMAADVDPGFHRGVFREALVAVDRFDDEEFAVYGLDPDEIAQVRLAMRDWATELANDLSAPPTS